jgi:hypothetical protein
MKSTAKMQMVMPTTTFTVSGSEKTTVPTMMAVIGSKAPNTEVFVGPISRVEREMVSIEIIVGNTANPAKQNTSNV